MRILDRQRYWAFIKAYVICFTSLVSLYIVIDAFSNFDEFTNRATGVREISMVMGRYYLVHMTEMYDRLCGVIGMMAAIFTVTWMQKNNELLAMLAAGISTQRVVRPVIISAILVSCVAVANQEFLIPDLAEELQMSHADDGNRPVRVFTRDDGNGVYMSGKEANRKAGTIIEFHATLSLQIYGSLREIEAEEAMYIPESAKRCPLREGWLIRGGKVRGQIDEELLKNGPLVMLDNDNGFPPPVDPAKVAKGQTLFLRSPITFASLTRSRRWYQYANTKELILGVSDPANEPEKQDISVFLHNRMLRPFLGLGLLLLTLPQVLGGYGRNMFINLGLSLGTAALFYGSNFLCQYLGSHDVLTPELAAWVPLITFGTLAAARWGSIRT